MEIRFLEPLWFLLLLVVPFVWVVPRRHPGKRVPVLRMLVFALLIAAMARPVALTNRGDAVHVLVVDASASLQADELPRLRQRVASIQPPEGGVQRVVVHGDPARAAALGLDPEQVDVWLQAADASLGQLLAAAQQQIPSGHAGAITLITDGLTPRADWARETQALTRAGIPVRTVRTPGPGPLLRIVDVRLIDPARVGETCRVGVAVAGRGRGRVSLRAGERELAAAEGFEVDGRGEIVLAFEPEVAGWLPMQAHFEVEQGRPADPRDLVRDELLAVQDPLRVLYLGERVRAADRSLATLVGRGVQLEVPAEGKVPSALESYDAVVLDDRPAASLPKGFDERLATAVRSGGVGLFMSGGRAAFGSGGWKDTAIEELLPIEFVHKEEKRDPSTTLVIIIDTSGSMGGGRVQLAKEVARLAIRRLLPHDKVGIVEFYGAKRWAAPIQPASNAIEIERALNRLNAGGGTVIMPAIEESFYGLQNVRTRYKHVLVLTDGGVEMGAFEPLIRKMADRGINVSTVLVGGSLHSEFLVDISNWGKGRFYSVPNRFNLPEVILKQPATARMPPYRRGRHPVQARGGAGWWGGVDPTTAPPLSGYVESGLRDDAETLLETRKEGHPVLATWRYGLGRVTTMMTEPVGPGTESWRAWDGYGPMLARVIARTARDAGEPFAFTLGREPGGARLIARRLERSTRRPAAIAIQGDEGSEESLRFEARAPGHFEARLALGDDEALRVSAGVAGDARGLRQRLALRALPDARQVERTVDPARSADLGRLAAATGGAHAESLDVEPRALAFPRAESPRRAIGLWPWLSLLTLLLWLAELLVRRLPGGTRTEG